MTLHFYALWKIPKDVLWFIAKSNVAMVTLFLAVNLLLQIRLLHNYWREMVHAINFVTEARENCKVWSTFGKNCKLTSLRNGEITWYLLVETAGAFYFFWEVDRSGRNLLDDGKEIVHRKSIWL